MITLAVITLSVVAAILYRMGGAGDPYNTKCRDIGIPVCVSIVLLFLFPSLLHSVRFFGALAITFGLVLGAQTTYWKKKGTDAKWFNWAFTGAGYSLALFPIAWVTGRWLGFGIRSIVLTGLTVLWSQLMDNVVWEECGRGALEIVTLPLLLI
jgi:hypothetical protein